MLVFQRALRWDAGDSDTSHLKMVVMRRWSEPRIIHSIPVDQVLLKPVFYQFAVLVCRLVLVPQWGMGVEFVSGWEKISWRGGGLGESVRAANGRRI